jgi:hypothetical protein
VLPFTPPDKDFDKVVYIIYDYDKNVKVIMRGFLAKKEFIDIQY